MHSSEPPAAASGPPLWLLLGAVLLFFCVGLERKGRGAALWLSSPASKGCSGLPWQQHSRPSLGSSHNFSSSHQSGWMGHCTATKRTEFRARFLWLQRKRISEVKLVVVCGEAPQQLSTGPCCFQEDKIKASLAWDDTASHLPSLQPARLGGSLVP